MKGMKDQGMKFLLKLVEHDDGITESKSNLQQYSLHPNNRGESFKKLGVKIVEPKSKLEVIEVKTKT